MMESEARFRKAFLEATCTLDAIELNVICMRNKLTLQEFTFHVKSNKVWKAKWEEVMQTRSSEIKVQGGDVGRQAT